MSNYLVYINIPPVPEVLLEPINTIVNKPPKPNSNVSSSYHFFQTRLVSDELQQWAQDTFKRPCYAQYQIIREGVMIHKDRGRNVAFNYLLDTGGPDVRTNVYDESKQLVFSEAIPERTWHRLKTDVFHDVRGMVSDRVALSIEIFDYKWDDPLNL